MTHHTNIMAKMLRDLETVTRTRAEAQKDYTHEITKAAAEAFGCPEWTASAGCDAQDGECYCRNAAQKVLEVPKP